jgi:hypothetical protein
MFQVIGESAVEELPNLVQLHQDPNQLTLAQVNGKYGLLGQAFYLSIKMLLVINPPKKTDKGKISRPGIIRMLELNCFFSSYDIGLASRLSSSESPEGERTGSFLTGSGDFKVFGIGEFFCFS